VGPDTHTLTLPGAMLRRGFWLYVWRVETPLGEMLYVGRTGDASSPNASAPYTRMGQHLGTRKTQNALRRHLCAVNVVPEDCAAFHLISHGPIFPEQSVMAAHRAPRDLVAALEKKLAETLAAAGYHVLNKVHCRKPLDEHLWSTTRTAFSAHFPKLARGN
jgi:hypothetical protein